MSKETFSTGEIAELTGVTVRTLQYYDNIGLLKANRKTSSGHRVYDKKSLTKLQQIIFYKSLGLKIDEIKEIIPDTTTKADLIALFENQRELLYQQLNNTLGNLAYIETSLDILKDEEELPMNNLIQLINTLNQDTFFEYQQVDFDEYSVKTFSEYYENPAEIVDVYWQWKSLVVEAVTLILDDTSPDSEQGLQFAEKYMDMVEQITKNDERLLEAHITSSQNKEQWPEEEQRLMEFTDSFIDAAIAHYRNKEDDACLR